jgi:Asp-tRNA(Asn)/Glu-tRNA(Gln) amidotransferase A subunit family amidase
MHGTAIRHEDGARAEPGPASTSTAPRLGWFARTGVAELAAQQAAGAVSAEELVGTALDEIERLNPVLNAFVTIDRDGARAAARRADQERESGLVRGPLHGIPIAVKDVVDTAGLRTTMGARHFAHHVPDEDAACVTRLREAGAVIVGKASTHEFAYGPTGDRAINGPTRNPHDPDRVSGGSSSGSAVAVAAGMVPLSVGTDTAGSVRIPAALCGVVGVKPGWGELPMEGVFPLAPSLDHLGVFGRTVDDCELMLAVLRGRPFDEMGSADGTGATQIGWIDPTVFGPIDVRVLDTVRAALQFGARQTGARVVPAALPGAERVRACFTAIQRSEAYAQHADRMRAAPELYDDEVRVRLQESAETRGWELVHARIAARSFEATVAATLDEVDLLALPTVPVTSFGVGVRQLELGSVAHPVREVLLSLTSPWNLLGLPAISIPAGRVDGLPVALQLVASTGDEGRLLSVARRIAAAA